MTPFLAIALLKFSFWESRKFYEVVVSHSRWHWRVDGPPVE